MQMVTASALTGLTGETEEHTLAIDPQERSSGFPFQKHSTAKEPLSRTFVLDAACDSMIR